ncbi:MAG: Tad domain-containing protein [Planctomycetota bacterium]|nr:Tad domain-containing protein [Planctomycetota bacterium]
MSSETNSNNRVGRWIARVHSDQSGSISVVTVFAVILLVMLLGMVSNSGLQVDQKIKMQNAADAATYSGAVVITRGMNTLAFTNHLLSDVFALTAFMREARDRSAESLTPKILSNWGRIGPALAGSEFRKFAELGQGIEEHVPQEREVVRTFSEWSAAASELMLPVFEQLLAEQQIPEFQRALVRTTPALAQAATEEIARRHGAAWPRPTVLHGVLWRTHGDAVGGPSEGELRTLPVVDPVLDLVPGQEEYAADARRQRFQLAHRYLRNWNDGSLPLFDSEAKMSQFASLWRIFTGGQLQKLLDSDYPDSNLPCQMLTRPERIANLNEHLENRYMFVGVVSRQKMTDRMPGVFRNPVAPDTQAYAQVMMFVPKRRLIKSWILPGGGGKGESRQTGIPGESLTINGPCSPAAPPPAPPVDGSYAVVVRQAAAYHPEPWTLINQNWTVQLTPATCGSLPRILSDRSHGSASASLQTPNLQSLTAEEFLWLSHH